MKFSKGLRRGFAFALAGLIILVGLFIYKNQHAVFPSQRISMPPEPAIDEWVESDASRSQTIVPQSESFVYTLKDKFTEGEIQQMTSVFHVTNENKKIEGARVITNYTPESASILLLNTETLQISYMSTSGISLPSSDIFYEITEVLKRLGIYDSHMQQAATYRDKTQPNMKFYEIRRDWDTMGYPVLDPMNVLNTSTDQKMSDWRDSFVNTTENSNIYETSDNKDGFERHATQNTITIGVDQSTQSIVLLTSTMKLLSGQQSVIPSQLLTKSEALEKVRAGDHQVFLTTPLEEDFSEYKNVYPHNKALAAEAVIEESALVYLQRPLPTHQTTLEPYYIFRGYSDLQSGYRAKVLVAVNALRDSKVQGISTLAQNSQGKTIQLGTFTVTPAPTRTPTSTYMPIPPTSLPITDVVTTIPSQITTQPTVPQQARTFTLPNSDFCHFNASEFTEVYEFDGILYGLYPKSTEFNKQAGWYVLAPEYFAKTQEEARKSLEEFLQHVPIDENDPRLDAWKAFIDKCISIGFSTCATRVAGHCTTDCSVPSPMPSPRTSALPIHTPVISQPSGGQNTSGLCIPLAIHGSAADKMDMLIIPLNFMREEQETTVLPLAERAIQALSTTNLSEHEDDLLKKMNWYVLNIHHPDFPIENFRQFEGGGRDDLIDFGIEANYCGRDRFMIMLKGENQGGFAVRGLGGVVWSESILGDGLTFAHEWGHAAGDLMDEYAGAANTILSANCTTTPSDHVYTSNYTEPCPQWDCQEINCSPKAQQLLQGMGCYPRCGASNYYRPLENSVMDNLDRPGNTIFSGPALVYMIEKVFGRYR